MEYKQNFKRAISPALALGLLLGVRPAAAQTNLSVYADALGSGWQNWSWSTTTAATTTPASLVHSGTNSLAVTYNAAYCGLYLAYPTGTTASSYNSITFWINSNGSANSTHNIYMYLVLGSTNTVSLPITGYISGGVIPTTGWTQVTVPLSALSATSGTINGVIFQEEKGSAEPTFYLDDVALVANTPGPVTIAVNAAANLAPISPMIYGGAFASQAQVGDLNITMNRSGGNGMSTYNYQNNANNTDADYYYESIPFTPVPGFTGPGAGVDAFISQTKTSGAQPLVTIPMLDWVAAINNPTGHPYKHSFSISKYGAQTGFDQYETDAGTGILGSTNKQITGNDPNDAYTPSTVAYQQGWVQHLLSKWGNSSGNGVRYYLMDNEPSIWFSTHVDVHPVGPSMQEMYNRITSYSSMIKSLDPNAQIVGPEEWSWFAMFRSGLDQQNGNSNDYTAHGSINYVPWLLQQFKAHDATTGVRTLDIFTTHYYPQGGETNNGTDATTQMLRNRSTRSLWDPNYTDESWQGSQYGGKIYLIPLMKQWVASYYPGLKIGVTEYTWGAEDYIGGATAQADVLGIMGREGLDVGTHWTTPTTGNATYNAFKMYRNYDGNKSTFGDVSVSTTVPNPDYVSAFGAKRTSDGALTLMVINKNLTGTQAVTLAPTNFLAGTTAQVWQLTSTNTITRLADATITGGQIVATLPALSITLFVLAPGTTSISGTVSLEGIASTAAPQTITFTLRPTDGTANVVKTASISPSGAFSLTGIMPRAYTLHISGPIWLAQNVSVDTTTGSVGGVSVMLGAGDADGNNQVDTADFNIFAGAYGSSLAVPGSGYEAAADFNCDGVVDAADFNLLVGEFGNVGAN